MFESIADSITVTNMDGNIVQTNESYGSHPWLYEQE
jgi:hypothetical protein